MVKVKAAVKKAAAKKAAVKKATAKKGKKRTVEEDESDDVTVTDSEVESEEEEEGDEENEENEEDEDAAESIPEVKILPTAVKGPVPAAPAPPKPAGGTAGEVTVPIPPLKGPPPTPHPSPATPIPAKAPATTAPRKGWFGIPATPGSKGGHKTGEKGVVLSRGESVVTLAKGLSVASTVSAAKTPESPGKQGSGKKRVRDEESVAALKSLHAFAEQVDKARPELEKLLAVVGNLDATTTEIYDAMEASQRRCDERYRKIERDIEEGEVRLVREALTKINQMPVDTAEVEALRADERRWAQEKEAKKQKKLGEVPRMAEERIAAIVSVDDAAKIAGLKAEAEALENQKRLLQTTIADLRKQIDSQKKLTSEIANCSSTPLTPLQIIW